MPLLSLEPPVTRSIVNDLHAKEIAVVRVDDDAGKSVRGARFSRMRGARA
ncbi:MAG: hypothetical protein HIU92_16455 [Proteobacteria bacterium]|nr:hypothetical protein [Pseudomonadota bacterium]